MKKAIIWVIGDIVLMTIILLTLSGEILPSLIGLALIGGLTFLYKHSEVVRLAIRAYWRISAQINYNFEQYLKK